MLGNLTFGGTGLDDLWLLELVRFIWSGLVWSLSLHAPVCMQLKGVIIYDVCLFLNYSLVRIQQS
jgi:hypothetical protein